GVRGDPHAADRRFYRGFLVLQQPLCPLAEIHGGRFPLDSGAGLPHRQRPQPGALPVNLEQLNIAIRPRRDWEAVDLGLLMAHRWWWQLQRVWLLLTLPWLLVSWVVPQAYLHWLV